MDSKNFMPQVLFVMYIIYATSLISNVPVVSSSKIIIKLMLNKNLFID